MLTLIKDHLNGLSLDDSLAKSKELDNIDPNEDLNKVDHGKKVLYIQYIMIDHGNKVLYMQTVHNDKFISNWNI